MVQEYGYHSDTKTDLNICKFVQVEYCCYASISSPMKGRC